MAKGKTPVSIKEISCLQYGRAEAGEKIAEPSLGVGIIGSFRGCS